MGVILDHYEEFSHGYCCHQPRLLSKLLVKLPDRQTKEKQQVRVADSVTSPKKIHLHPPKNNSRVIHEVIDFPHGYTSDVHEKDETEKHQVVFWRHPQHKLQVEGIELRQKELEREYKTNKTSTENAICVWVFCFVFFLIYLKTCYLA